MVQMNRTISPVLAAVADTQATIAYSSLNGPAGSPLAAGARSDLS